MYRCHSAARHFASNAYSLLQPSLYTFTIIYWALLNIITFHASMIRSYFLIASFNGHHTTMDEQLKAAEKMIPFEHFTWVALRQQVNKQCHGLFINAI